MELADRVHTLYVLPLNFVARRQSSLLRLCIETLREGMELQQPGDENIISLAKEREINVDVYLEVPPVIAVFSKYDELVILQCVYDGCQYF